MEMFCYCFGNAWIMSYATLIWMNGTHSQALKSVIRDCDVLFIVC